MNAPPFPIAGVISDFDGTLLDSERFHMIAWRSVAKEFRITDDINFEAFIGTSDAVVAETLIARYALETSVLSILERKGRALLERYDETLRPFPGVMETLIELERRGIPLYSATSGRRAHVEAAARRTGIDRYIKGYVCAEDVSRRKPAPDAYLLAAARLGVSKERIIAVEDSAPGVEAAKQAGLYTFAIPNSVTKDALKEADAVIDRFDEILLREKKEGAQ